MSLMSLTFVFAFSFFHRYTSSGCFNTEKLKLTLCADGTVFLLSFSTHSQINLAIFLAAGISRKFSGNFCFLSPTYTCFFSLPLTFRHLCISLVGICHFPAGRISFTFFLCDQVYVSKISGRFMRNLPWYYRPHSGSKKTFGIIVKK